MKLHYNANPNFLNEALIISTRAFQAIGAESEIQFIDYSKTSITKEEFESKYSDFIRFYNVVSEESIIISKDYLELEGLLAYTKDSPSIFNSLIFSSLKKSIKDYDRGEFVEGLKTSLLNNITFRTGDDISIEELDDISLVENLFIFNNSQKYDLLKFLSNTNKMQDRFFEYIEKIENVLRKNFEVVKNLFIETLNKLKEVNVFELEGIENFKYQSVYKSIEETNVNLSLNLFNSHGLSVDVIENNKYIADVFVSLKVFLLSKYQLNLFERKESAQKKLNILSDATRFEIIYYLSTHRAFGKELSEKLDISKGTVSYHLNALINEDLVTMEIEGKKIYYSLNRNGFDEILSFLSSLLGVNNEARNIQ